MRPSTQAALGTLTILAILAVVVAVTRLVFWLTGGAFWGLLAEIVVMVFGVMWLCARVGEDRP